MMRLIQLAVACVAVLFAAPGQVRAGIITIDFDGFTPNSSFGGGVEDGIVVGGISGPVAVDGNYLGPLSGLNSIHHDSFGSASFSLSDSVGNTFTLSSFFAGSDFGGADPLTLSGFLGGLLVGTDVFNPNPPGSYVSFTPTNLLGVKMDTLVFDMGPAIPGPTHIDDIVLNVSVPEPCSLVLFGIGASVAGVGTARRRRREKRQEVTV